MDVKSAKDVAEELGITVEQGKKLSFDVIAKILESSVDIAKLEYIKCTYENRKRTFFVFCDSKL